MKAEPRNPSLWLRVADAAFLSGDAERAADAAGRAHGLGGGDDLLRRALQGRLLAGQEAAARALLSGLAGAEPDFWRGVLACRAGRWTTARALLLAAAAADPARLAERAGLFAAWASHRAAGGKRPARRGIVIAGLGWRRPRQTTVGALDALASCRRLVAVANTLDDATRDLLCLFRARVTAVAFRGSEAEALKAARTAVAAARTGPAGTVTRGNPLVYGRFAARLVALARARKIPFEVLPGVSSYEGLAAEGRPAPGSPLGLEVRGVHDLAGAGARAAVVFTPRSPTNAAPPRASALFLASEGGMTAPARVSAAKAAEMIRRGGAPGILYYLPGRSST